MTKRFAIPFANSGDKLAVPDPTQGDGSVSYNTGFGPDYQRPIGDPLRKTMPRDSTNQLFFDLTEFAKEVQDNGVPPWRNDVDYAVGGIALGSNGVLYRAIQVSGPSTTPRDPVSSPTFWTSFLTAASGFPVGSAALPGLFPAGDTNTGFWSPSPDSIAWSTGGLERYRCNPSGRHIFGGATDDGVNQIQAANIAKFGGLRVSNTPNASSDVLDHYEESTFLPVISGSAPAGAATYILQEGRYTRIGNRVFFSIRLDWSAHTGGGFFTITGLPYVAAGGTQSYALSIIWSGVAVGAGRVPTAQIPVGTSIIQLTGYDPSTGGGSGVPVDASGTVFVNGSYVAA